MHSFFEKNKHVVDLRLQSFILDISEHEIPIFFIIVVFFETPIFFQKYMAIIYSKYFITQNCWRLAQCQNVLFMCGKFFESLPKMNISIGCKAILDVLGSQKLVLSNYVLFQTMFAGE